MVVGKITSLLLDELWKEIRKRKLVESLIKELDKKNRILDLIR